MNTWLLSDSYDGLLDSYGVSESALVSFFRLIWYKHKFSTFREQWKSEFESGAIK
ncbi:hypothetical protein [Nostoc sp. ChiQUE01b]|uniref:hypothetical protein n=1 Tax=Nostoc sp. ChiQUE01b TaxID=3075376 RepID=UPI002AD32DFF|nr:hypothetical protein [Nostoc sp. ChiQUE01b]